VGMSRHAYAAVKKCVLSLFRKVDKELVLRYVTKKFPKVFSTMLSLNVSKSVVDRVSVPLQHL